MPLPLGSDLSPSLAELSEHLQRLLQDHLGACSPESTRWVACSGGMDSLLLLWVTARCCPQQVHALHVDHGLQPDSARWAAELAALCGQWQVPLTAERVTVPHGSNLEARARESRYQAFAHYLQPNDVLLLGHHRDDQLETLLLRLTRGSGLDGLAGMPAQRPLGLGQLIRPWLTVSRHNLAALAQALDLSWQEDPSNKDLRHDRNYIRHELMPRLRERWPGVEQTLHRTQQHLAVASGRLRAQDSERLAEAQRADGQLALPALWALPSLQERLSVLRLWLQRRGVTDISQAQLSHLHDDVVMARQDARGRLQVQGRYLQRYRGMLYCFRPLDQPPASPQPLLGSPEQGATAKHPGLGELRVLPAVRQVSDRRSPALSAEKLARCALTVRCRQGGERLRSADRQRSRDLKRLLQELAVPPWLRDHLPLLYADEQLVAVADLAIAHDWQAEPGKDGCPVRWQPPA
ncbi:MAG: tRNA lysidine(34) synthetase TilS [Natronospirillum sp.]|uniref:tRNA lysidine(34) synthetase TilS n=1 Tax=Natronospirillum sp. TaxID=2812955 RepID=UPI0025DC0CFD|nr:tRNA lysidine(34) synthetase TilS [Natronospirillum sp.]MCH8552337.1 tRNA lysidine(34) synthetase TilS [Natronospirillum sp.]